MASSTTHSKSARKRTARNGDGKAKAKEPKYGEVAKCVSDKARKMACPTSMQGPIPKQCHDVMQTLTEGPAEALKRVGLTQKDARAIGTGKAEPAHHAQARPAGRARAGQRGRAAVDAGQVPGRDPGGVARREEVSLRACRRAS